MFEKSLAFAGSNRYLGSSEVVEDLVRKFIARVYELKSPDDLIAACNRMAEIFSGMDPAYQLDAEWAERAGLHQSLCERLGISFNTWGVEIVKIAFGIFARDALGILKSKENQEAQVDALIKYMVAVMIGTADALYPYGRSWND